MVFTSPEFVLFCAVFFPAFFLLPHRWRWIWMLGASYFFYAFGSGAYVLLIVFSTFVDYTAARLIERSENRGRRRLLLALSLATNLGVLFTFKYYNFFVGSFNAALDLVRLPHAAPTSSLLLPIGISFYTFQSMAYTIDVYRRVVPAERHAGIFATYIAFFPQLVAGPIERAANILPQLRQRAAFDPERTISGLRLILWGVFKKIVIADRLAIYVNAVYAEPRAYTGEPLIMATIFFAFQVYCDFSAYSDIAVGLARIMGINLMLNFRQPFFARSVREFWSRWHISLSTWFRDYLYISIGGNRVAFPRYLLNLMVVFVVSGLWHGAAWTFVIWGALHGLYVVGEAVHGRLKLPRLPRSPAGTLIGMAFTFALVVFAFIFFRAASMSDALYIAGAWFQLGSFGDLAEPFAGGLMAPRAEFLFSIGLLAFLFFIDALDARYGLEHVFERAPILVRWSAYYMLGGLVMFSGLYGTGVQEFIYFQF
jgi:alginate O-acetyltransferase complex protein AlgI